MMFLFRFMISSRINRNNQYHYFSGGVMKTKKKNEEHTAEEKAEAQKVKTTKRSRVVKKPSNTAKPLAGKTTAEKTGMTKKPNASASAATPQVVKAERPGIKREHIRTGNICNVTFMLPEEAAARAETVTLVGDFNGWNREVTSLKRLENGDFTVTIELDAGKEYRFRYLIDGSRWENDWHADKYVRNFYGTEDSVVCV
jgi:Carbohydrate-binding module 48 (Isoamylase N-terminal domain)